MSANFRGKGRIARCKHCGRAPLRGYYGAVGCKERQCVAAERREQRERMMKLARSK